MTRPVIEILFRKMYILIGIVFIVCLPNVSYSITNQQFINEPIANAGGQSHQNKFLLYVNSPPRFRERAREDSRENLTRAKSVDATLENFKLDQRSSEFKAEINQASDIRNHGHRDQRRVRYEKNLYDSNRTVDQQHQWLPEQTIWRPYYLPRRFNPPFRHGIIPFQSNLMGQQSIQSMPRMPPPYELFPPTQAINPQQPPPNLNSRLPPNNQQLQPPNRFNPVLVDNNGVLNVELVNDRFLNPADQQQFNFGNVHVIDGNQMNNQVNNQADNQLTNNELEKERPSLDKKINDKLKFDNNSDIQLVNAVNSADGQFKPNGQLIDPSNAGQQYGNTNTEIEQNFNFQTNSLNKNRINHKLGNSDPQLFINRIKQTVVTNESFSLQNPTTGSKPRIEQKSNLITNLNETTKILDTSPQHYSPVHFRQTFEQIQAQQRENQRFTQFTPLLYSSNQQVLKANPTTKSSLDVNPQLVNPLVSGQELTNQQNISPQLINPFQQQTSPPPIQPPFINPHSTQNMIKRLKQQQLQNALLARLGAHNGNSVELARRMNSVVQERATREQANPMNNLNSSPSSVNSAPSMDASKSNPKEFFTRRTNTHRYVIVSILMLAIIVISIGITVIYVKQKRLNLHNTSTGDLNTDIGSSYGIRRFCQRSAPSSNTPSDSDSYGASYLSNRSTATSVETGSTTDQRPKSLATLRTGNVITHR